MASSMISSAAVATTRASPAQASMVAPFNGLESVSSFPISKKSVDITSPATNGGRVQCMKEEGRALVIYLPDLSIEQLLKEIEYLLRSE
ncbi:hypothetical protein ACH5RR_013836 [Cinchona calisaya]|uniref:Ribulose-1,5-bisphosphate carboxylase small subunit N-terminal domain-containing protein n=1 Tax=Cinchona calisaya TaxID=153742 RepID=A0ABD3A155_9GENT